MSEPRDVGITTTPQSINFSWVTPSSRQAIRHTRTCHSSILDDLATYLNLERLDHRGDHQSVSHTQVFKESSIGSQLSARQTSCSYTFTSPDQHGLAKPWLNQRRDG